MITLLLASHQPRTKYIMHYYNTDISDSYISYLKVCIHYACAYASGETTFVPENTGKVEHILLHVAIIYICVQCGMSKVMSYCGRN